MNRTGLTVTRVVDAIRTHATRDPDAPAIVGTGDAPPMTYADLAALIDDAGRALGLAGLEPGDRVALVCAPGPLAAAGFLALSAHVIVAPLNCAAPPSELRETLGELGVAAVFACPENRTRVEGATTGPVFVVKPQAPAGAFTVERIAGDDLAASPTAPLPAADAPALILHSSGTTGRPKQITLSHANLAMSARNVAETLGLTRQDRGLIVMPLFHIHGIVAGLLAPLVAGGAVVAAPGFEAQRFLDWRRKTGATWFTAVPTMHQAILDATAELEATETEGAFRFIRSSSSALPDTVRQALEEQFAAPVVEAYGMTEAAHQITSQRPEGTRNPGSVGQPVGVEIGVVAEENGAVVDRGAGEIVLRGPTIGRISGDPDALLEGGWLRTGDIGVIDETGELRLTARVKEIVKRGGFQIAPREVEDALLGFPHVAEALVFGVSHDTLGQDLVAAVVLRPGERLAENETREALFDLVSPHKVPSRIFSVDALPRTPSGKPRRTDLAAHFADRLVAAHEEPQGALEELVADIFEEVVPGAVFGRHEDFFLSGGDSLSGARAIGRFRHLLQSDIPLGLLFRAPTVARFADRLAALDGGRIMALIREAESELDESV